MEMAEYYHNKKQGILVNVNSTKLPSVETLYLFRYVTSYNTMYFLRPVVVF